MESKRKTRKVHRVSKATQELPKSEPQPLKVSPEVLINQNGLLVEELFSSKPWLEIAFPLLQESIASVSRRFTNGRFYQGTLTKSKMNRDELAGYQMALEEFHNRLHDFVFEKEKLRLRKNEEKESKNAPLYNPFMEEDHEE